MPRLKKILKVVQTHDPWMVELHFPYHPPTLQFIKQFPGRTWVPEKKCWRFPSELVSKVEEFVINRGWETDREVPLIPVPDLVGAQHDKLHEFQARGIDMALLEPSTRWIFADDTGLGKTVQAIEVMRRTGAGTALIVVPAIVRSKWEEELDEWWPEHPEVGRITCGSERGGLSKAERERITRAYQAPIKVVSYNLLLFVCQTKYDCIILDEAHKLKDPTVEWSRRARNLVMDNPQASVLALTATPAAEKPLDVCGIVECVWPGRMGDVDPIYGLRKVCKERYANKEESEYGCKYYGANPVHIDELQERLKSMMSRTTKRDVPELLPPFDVSYRTVDPLRTSTHSALESLKYGWVEGDIALANDIKMVEAGKWVPRAREQHAHVAVLTDRRDSATGLAQRLKDEGVENVVCITGAKTPEKRNELLAAAAERPGGVVVATMHSIGIGINLTFCTAALVAELCYRPEVLIQALGRFSRLSGTVPSSVEILSVKSTVDEVIAHRVRDKIIAINAAVEAGMGEHELAAKLGISGTLEDMLREALAAPEEDEYDYDE